MFKNKKRVLSLAAIVLLVVSFSGLAYFLNRNSNEGVNNTENSKAAIVPKKACDVFPLESAKKILGDDAKLLNSYDGTAPGQEQSSTQNEGSEPVVKDPASDKVNTDNLAKFNKQDNYETVAAVTTCNYSKSSLSAEEASKKALRLTIRSSSVDQAEKDFKATQKSSKPVEGLGVLAYWMSSKDIFGKSGSGQMLVLKGENLIIIDAGNNIEKSKEVAAQVLENL